MTTVSLSIGVLAAILPALAQEVRNPEQMGPYPVGVTSLQFDEPARRGAGSSAAAHGDLVSGG
jgi:hypothetical protein